MGSALLWPPSPPLCDQFHGTPRHEQGEEQRALQRLSRIARGAMWQRGAPSVNVVGARGIEAQPPVRSAANHVAVVVVLSVVLPPALGTDLTPAALREREVTAAGTRVRSPSLRRRAPHKTAGQAQVLAAGFAPNRSAWCVAVPDRYARDGPRGITSPAPHWRPDPSDRRRFGRIGT